MKRVTYSFLLIFLLSCSPHSDLTGNRINVFFRDSLVTPHEYYLLAVRDTALVVAPGHYDDPGQAFTIQNSKILYVSHAADNGRGLGTLVGGLAGFAAAGGTVTVIGMKGDAGSGEGVAIAAALVSIPGCLLGMIIGYNLAPDENEYDLTRSHDRYYLGGYAKYPDSEPPELQKIK
jgi:hypothetical protein